MQIRHATPCELDRADDGRQPRWLETACTRLRRLASPPHGRVLVAEEDGETRAVLGLRMSWGANGRLVKATICILSVDPNHTGRGIGSRLVRFAEGIARIHGCDRVDVTPDLETWGDGHCWPSLGYSDPGPGLHKVLRSPAWPAVDGGRA